MTKKYRISLTVHADDRDSALEAMSRLISLLDEQFWSERNTGFGGTNGSAFGSVKIGEVYHSNGGNDAA